MQPNATILLCTRLASSCSNSRSLDCVFAWTWVKVMQWEAVCVAYFCWNLLTSDCFHWIRIFLRWVDCFQTAPIRSMVWTYWNRYFRWCFWWRLEWHCVGFSWYLPFSSSFRGRSHSSRRPFGESELSAHNFCSTFCRVTVYSSALLSLKWVVGAVSLAASFGFFCPFYLCVCLCKDLIFIIMAKLC